MITVATQNLSNTLLATDDVSSDQPCFCSKRALNEFPVHPISSLSACLPVCVCVGISVSLPLRMPVSLFELVALLWGAVILIITRGQMKPSHSAC